MAVSTDNLTPRQREVYERAEKGMKPADIARDLALSPNAVQGHLSVLRSRGLIPKTATTKSKRSRSGARNRSRNGSTAVTASRAGSDSGRAVLFPGVPSLDRAITEIDERLESLEGERARLLAIKNAAEGVPA